MNRSALPLVALALAGSASGVRAQSSVTLYGLLDTSVMYVTKADASGGNLVSAGSGNLLGNRWGLKGSEDLGGGLKAIVQIEGGFNPNTGRLGQGGRLFGRQSFVGLSSPRFGTLTLGRQYDVLTDATWSIGGVGYFGNAFSTPGDVDNYNATSRTDKTVKYVSPSFNGLTLSGMYALGGVAGSTGSGQTWGAAAAYKNGGLSVGGGYLFMTNTNPAATLRTGWSGTSDGTFGGSAINGGYASAKSISIARATVNYDAGAMIYGAYYSNARYTPDAYSAFRSTQRYDTGGALLGYRPSPVVLLGLSYAYTKASGDTSASYHQVALGSDYFLSKRTDLYLVGAWQRANGTQRTANGGLQAARASIGSFGFAGGGTNQLLVSAGMRHRF
ncbi:porin [Burkholderia alba]|uniref:porin n=1 Tax=Burkholderia alba TaxID=2683677 RepID=UPI002B057C96|nr:porin [Burkholderia alba]